MFKKIIILVICLTLFTVSLFIPFRPTGVYFIPELGCLCEQNQGSLLSLYKNESYDFKRLPFLGETVNKRDSHLFTSDNGYYNKISFHTIDLYYYLNNKPNELMRLTSYWWGCKILIDGEPEIIYGYRYINVIFLVWIAGIITVLIILLKIFRNLKKEKKQ